MAQKKTKSAVGTKVAIGASVAGLAGAAYLLFGPEGKKHQKDLRNWVHKVRKMTEEEFEAEIAILKKKSGVLAKTAKSKVKKITKKARA